MLDSSPWGGAFTVVPICDRRRVHAVGFVVGPWLRLGGHRYRRGTLHERAATNHVARCEPARSRARRADTPAVVPALIRSYEELAEHEGDLPSPVVPTYLSLERSEATDVLL